MVEDEVRKVPLTRLFDREEEDEVREKTDLTILSSMFEILSNF
jgi:hypothetical protein